MAASTIVEHPVLGVYGFGCDVAVNGDVWIIYPRDGLRMRVHDTVNNWSLEIDRNAIRKIEVNVSKKTLSVIIDEADDSVGAGEPHILLKSETSWYLDLT